MKLPAGHWLEITRWHDDRDCTEGEDYTVHHPVDCPVETWPDESSPADPEERADGRRTCRVGYELASCGLDSLDVAALMEPRQPEARADEAWRLLPAGWYEIEAWSSRSPGGPWGPEEWDGGLSIVRGPYPGPPGTLAYQAAFVGEAFRELGDELVVAFRPVLEALARLARWPR